MTTYILVYTDSINMSDSKMHVTDHVEIVGVTDDEDKAKAMATEGNGEGQSVRWQMDGWGRWLGLVVYSGEVEEAQYYTIVEVN